jgi:hypothetical protein
MNGLVQLAQPTRHLLRRPPTIHGPAVRSEAAAADQEESKPFRDRFRR